VPAGLVPVYVHRQSRTLSEILRELLHGSNNYMANQIFLEIGAKSLGGPVSLEKSVAAARKMLAAHDLADAIQLEEGSGLSRGNRFTARGLAKVLNLFAPHLSLLESRKGASYKTGTLEGVRTLAGYASSSKHGPVRFVIALRGNNGAMRFDGNEGGAPPYHPNSFNGPMTLGVAARESVWSVGNDATVYRYETGAIDNFEQPADFWKNVCKKFKIVNKIVNMQKVEMGTWIGSYLSKNLFF